MKLKMLSSTDLRRALPMCDTVEAMKRAFAAFSSGEAQVPQRLVVRTPGGDGLTLVKPASFGPDGLGAKLVSVFPGNGRLGKKVVNGIVVVLDPCTGEPAALCDGAFLTAWRTGAASGAATDLLAREDARTGALIGCGEQGKTQIIGITAVRSLRSIRVFDVDRAKAEQLAEELQPELEGCGLVVSASAEQAISGADVICTATGSAAPVMRGSSISPGAHLNAIGSFTAQMRELDRTALERASIFVDSRESAKTEAGELIDALKGGITSAGEWKELGEVVNGMANGRMHSQEITLFKSVGLAVQDIAAAALALSRCDEMGLGQVVELD